MLIKKLIIGLLTFYAYEFRSPKRLSPATEVVVERQLETRKKKQAEKKKTKLYDKRKWKKQREYKQQHFKLKGTQSKDARYSNQQKIRRMFRNS